MNVDLLGQAARALRDTPGHGRAEETFGRVLRDVRRAERRRRTAVAAILPFALLLTTMGAWAATTGRLAAVVGRLRPSRPPVGRTVVAEAGIAAATPGPEIVPLPLRLASAPPGPEDAQPAARPPTVRRPRGLDTRPLDDGAPLAPSPDEVYRRAHDAHFGRADYAAALELWDAYLGLSPLPRFALEARFNRAIALVRLGRRDEARGALRPFADGDYGSYRAGEARALLRALGDARDEN